MILQFAVAPENQAFYSEFLAQPIDVIMYQILLATGWIPIAAVLVWGLAQLYVAQRQNLYAGSLKWVLLAIDVPRETEQSPKAMENVFASMAGCKSSITWKEKWILGKFNPRFSFEIVSDEGYIQFYIRCMTRFRDVIEAGIYAQYPDAEIREVEDYVHSVPSDYPDDEWDMWGTELVLKEANYLPIRTYPMFEHTMTQELKDPLAVILEQLGRMKPGEKFWIQLMIEICSQDWTKDGAAYIKKTYGIEDKPKQSGFTKIFNSVLDLPSEAVEQLTGVSLLSILGTKPAETPQEDIWKAFKITLQEKAQVEGVAMKISKLGYKAKLRLLYFGRKEVYHKQARTAVVKGMFLQYTHQDMNGFGLFGPQTPKDDYFWQEWSYTARQTRLVKAYKGRSFSTGATSFILNTEELASIYHFPTITVKAPLVKKTEAKKAEPPTGLAVSVEEEGLPGFPARVEKKKEIIKEMPPILPVLPDEEMPLPVAATAPAKNAEIPGPELPGRTTEFAGRRPSLTKKAPPPPGLDLKPDIQVVRPTPMAVELPDVSESAAEEALPAELETRSAAEPVTSLPETPTEPETLAPELPAAPVQKPQQKKIPDAMRVLFEPDVQPEDVGIRGAVPGRDKEDNGTPENLPV